MPVSEKFPEFHYHAGHVVPAAVFKRLFCKRKSGVFRSAFEHGKCNPNQGYGKIINFGSVSGEEGTVLMVYIWLEGCDKDCTQNLCSTTLRNLALSFAGFEAK